VGVAFAEIRAQEILAQQYRTEYDAWVRLNDAVTSASAALRSAEQALDQARAAASDLTLVAPIAGTVRIATDRVAGGGRTLTEGSDVTAAQPIVTVTATGGHRVDLTVPETDLAPVAVGARVAVDLEAYPGTALTGRVTRIVAAPAPVATGVTAATPTSATFVAEVELDGDAGLELRDGLTGTGSLDDLAFGDRYEVTLEVDEVDVVLVAVGQPVSIELDALRATPLTGTIVAIAAAPVRNATGATVYPTRVRLDAPEGAAELPALRGGLTGTGDVEVERLEAPLTVPSIALLRSGGNEVVFVVRDGAAVEVPVTVLAFGDLRAAIEGDLEPGEQVITTGIERVRDGDPVEVG
jgi:multidrug efflux pump subunit AcrA (membrane-fusion protein)